MRKKLLFLTGAPGTGKTTILLKVADALKSKGYRIGGMITREVRSCGSRVGFQIIDVQSSRQGWLAHVNLKTGPKVGRYRVNLEDLNSIGAAAILKAVKGSDIILIDEIGPMELFSEKFKEAVRKAVESGKIVIGTVHWRMRDATIEEIKQREDAEIHVVTRENRDKLPKIIVAQVSNFKEGHVTV